MTDPIHIAVAVIVSAKQEVLLAMRQAHQHQGGLWEFPGGKVEKNESVYDALLREINEEVGITITSAHELVKISHDYGDKAFIFDVWLVNAYNGKPVGLEGQQLRWCAITELKEDDFPAANVAIIDAIKVTV